MTFFGSHGRGTPARNVAPFLLCPKNLRDWHLPSVETDPTSFGCAFAPTAPDGLFVAAEASAICFTTVMQLTRNPTIQRGAFVAFTMGMGPVLNSPTKRARYYHSTARCNRLGRRSGATALCASRAPHAAGDRPFATSTPDCASSLEGKSSALPALLTCP